MTPTRKITAVGIGGAIAAVIVGIAVWAGAPQPPAGLEAGIATVAAFAAGYLTSEDVGSDDGRADIVTACVVILTVLAVLWTFNEVPC